MTTNSYADKLWEDCNPQTKLLINKYTQAKVAFDHAAYCRMSHQEFVEYFLTQLAVVMLEKPANG